MASTNQPSERVWLAAACVALLTVACGNPTPPHVAPMESSDPGFNYSFTSDGSSDGNAVADSGATDSAAVKDVGAADAGSSDSAAVDSAGLDTTPGKDSANADVSVDSGTTDIGTPPVDATEDTGPTAICGDAVCTPVLEDCSSCAKDCGACPICGDGKCAAGIEDCKSCPADCNECPKFCGDGACDKTKEDCQSCAADCGNCPSVCGNGKCEMPGETYDKCPKDCPPTGTCDPLTSNGCVASQQCYPSAAKPVCADTGKVGDGDFCQINTQCLKGYLCVGDKCTRICDHTGANKMVGCPADQVCDKLVFSDGKDVGWSLGICFKVDNCNVTTEAGCAAAEMCVLSANGKICVKAGLGKPGASCKYLNDCAKGLICINNPGVCKLKCHMKGGSPKCAAGACSLVTIQPEGKPKQSAPDDLGVCG